MTKEVIAYHGGASKIEITPNLVMRHHQAHHNYQKRIEEEAKQKRNEERDRKADHAAAKKRQAEDEEKSKYEEKRQKLESEEKALSDEIKYHKTMLKEQQSRCEKPNIKLPELKAAMSAQKSAQDLIDKKEQTLREITAKKVKLLDSRIKKK